MNARDMTNVTTVLKSTGFGAATVLFLLGISYCAPATAYEQHKQQEFQGKWMVINFWAQWCKSCREEMPELNRLTVILGAKDIQVLGINYDSIEGAELDEALKSLDIRFPQMHVRQQASFNFKMPAALPATYIVSPAGVVKASLIGKQNLDSILTALEDVNPQFVTNELVSNELAVTP